MRSVQETGKLIQVFVARGGHFSLEEVICEQDEVEESN